MQASTELIQAACNGDPAAISKLLTVCQPDLKRFARRTCSNTEDAEDAVQIALWRLHRKIGTLRSVASFASWLFRVVERECFRLFNGRSKTDELDQSAAEALPAPHLPIDLQLDLSRAIVALPEAYRVVLILRDVDELTAPEVATHLDLSLEAVKSRLHRARRMVRDRLIASGYWNKDGSEVGDHHVL